MRLFIAINLTSEVRRAVDEVVAPIRTQIPSIRWVTADRLHVTLKFLGEQPSSMVSGLQEVLGHIVPGHRLGDSVFADCGAFPNFRRPRVVWMGVKCPGLVEFAAALDVALSPLGVAPDARRFTPHLTLGRVSTVLSTRDVERLRRWGSAVGEVGRQAVSSIDLMQSHMSSGGPTYTTLASAGLGEPCGDHSSPTR